VKRRLRSRTSARRVLLTPSRADLVDAGMVLLLGLLALVEFRTTYAGWDFLIVSLVGLLLGVAISYLANALRQPVIVLLVMGAAAFFLLGGAVAVRNAPGASVIPTGGTLKSLAAGAVHGWRNLLTTVPPVDGSGALLVLPYILGLFGGLGGYALARRTTGAAWPVLVSLTIFAAVILLGSLQPRTVVLSGTLFAVIALLWIAARYQRQRPVVSTGADRKTRMATAAVLVGITGVGAYVMGPHVPGGNHERVVLRKYVVPPSNVGDYPSPLAEFRQFAGDQKDVNGKLMTLADTTLFTVGGTLPAGSEIRFAALDTYNGMVWTASDYARVTARGTPDTFLKVGPTLDNPAPGPHYSMTVRVGAYDDYWMPTAGAVQAVRFTDADSTQQTADFRYNLATGTGVVPGKLRAENSYNLTVAGVKQRQLTTSVALASDGANPLATARGGDFLKDTVKTLTGDSTDTTAQVFKIAHAMQATGKFTHGSDNGSGNLQFYLPGHSAGRLRQFVDGVAKGFPPFVGDDEQYAAAFALMIEELGVPARVVVGVPALPSNRIVKGSDVHAWVEVQSAEHAWLTVPSSTFISSTPPPKIQQQQNQQEANSAPVQPPVHGRPKTLPDNSAQAEGDSSDLNKKKLVVVAAGGGIPGWLVAVGTYGGLPILSLLVIIGAIVGAKAWRRARRRTRGAPSARLVSGWREVTDHARDLGSPVPDRATRKEQANALSEHQLAALARLADAHVFGGGEITDEHAHTFWAEVAAARKHMSGTVGRWRRLRAAVSVSTFRPNLPGASS
jgi:hypothetical protein